MTAQNAPINANLPVDILEARAEAQREKLHHDVEELRTTVRETFDKKKIARQYFWPVCGAAVILGLVLGYGLTGIFRRN